MALLSFYSDEHLGYAVIRGLRRRGIDIISAVDAQMLGRSDLEHLEFARTQLRVMLTQDQDFLILHAQNIPHQGIIFARQGMTIGRIINGVSLLWNYLEADEMVQRLEYL